jgi:hypothetical protein
VFKAWDIMTSTVVAVKLIDLEGISHRTSLVAQYALYDSIFTSLLFNFLNIHK